MKTLKAILPLFFLFLISTLNAQMKGHVNLEQLGISFTIPDGWVGQEGEGAIILGSYSVPGMILMTTNDASDIEQLKMQARQPMQDQNGTNIMLSGDIEDLGNNAIGGNLSGTMQYQQVKGYAIGVVNPYGAGVTIMSAALPAQYSDDLKKAAMAIKNSLKFKKREIGPIVAQWKAKVGGRRLTYMDSYYSPSYTDGGVSGGYSSETIIELCNSGYFYHSEKSEITAGSSSSSAYNSSNDQGQGKWEITANATGGPVLKLNFHNGEVYTYDLTFKDKYLHMNGYKYFRTALEYCN